MAMGTEGDSRKRFRVIACTKSHETSYVHSYTVHSIYIKNPLAQKSKLRTELSVQDLGLYQSQQISVFL